MKLFSYEIHCHIIARLCTRVSPICCRSSISYQLPPWYSLSARSTDPLRCRPACVGGWVTNHRVKSWQIAHVSQQSFPNHMAHRATLISVSLALIRTPGYEDSASRGVTVYSPAFADEQSIITAPIPDGWPGWVYLGGWWHIKMVCPVWRWSRAPILIGLGVEQLRWSRSTHYHYAYIKAP